MFSTKWVKFSPAKIQLDIAWERFTLSGWQSYDGRSKQQISSFMISLDKPVLQIIAGLGLILMRLHIFNKKTMMTYNYEMATKRAMKCVDIYNHHWQKESLVRLIIFFNVDFIISWPCWLLHECFHLSCQVRCQLRTDARLKNIWARHGKVELEKKYWGSVRDAPLLSYHISWVTT